MKMKFLWVFQNMLVICFVLWVISFLLLLVMIMYVWYCGLFVYVQLIQIEVLMILGSVLILGSCVQMLCVGFSWVLVFLFGSSIGIGIYVVYGWWCRGLLLCGFCRWVSRFYIVCFFVFNQFLCGVIWQYVSRLMVLCSIFEMLLCRFIEVDMSVLGLSVVWIVSVRLFLVLFMLIMFIVLWMLKKNLLKGFCLWILVMIVFFIC